jgi:hypothetical protein
LDTRSLPREKNSPQEDSTIMKTSTQEITKTDHKEAVEATSEVAEAALEVTEAASEVKEEAASEVIEEAEEVADTMMIFHHSEKKEDKIMTDNKSKENNITIEAMIIEETTEMEMMRDHLDVEEVAQDLEEALETIWTSKIEEVEEVDSITIDQEEAQDMALQEVNSEITMIISVKEVVTEVVAKKVDSEEEMIEDHHLEVIMKIETADHIMRDQDSLNKNKLIDPHTVEEVEVDREILNQEVDMQILNQEVDIEILNLEVDIEILNQEVDSEEVIEVVIDHSEEEVEEVSKEVEIDHHSIDHMEIDHTEEEVASEEVTMINQDQITEINKIMIDPQETRIEEVHLVEEDSAEVNSMLIDLNSTAHSEVVVIDKEEVQADITNDFIRCKLAIPQCEFHNI